MDVPQCTHFLMLWMFLQTCSYGEVLHLESVPRLGDSSHIDHYISCNVVGRTMHWEVNNYLLPNLRGNNITAVQTCQNSSFSCFSFIYSSKSVSNGFNMTSILLLTTEQYPLRLFCISEVDHLALTITGSSEQVVLAKKNNPSMRLDYVLSDKIIPSTTAASYQTSVFVCGLKRNFQEWFINSSSGYEYGVDKFFEPDTIRYRLSKDKSFFEHLIIVLQITGPYEIVTALFLSHSFEVPILCTSGIMRLQIIASDEPLMAVTSNVSSISTINSTFFSTMGTKINTGLNSIEITVIIIVAILFAAAIIFLIAFIIIMICIFLYIGKRCYICSKRGSPSCYVHSPRINTVKSRRYEDINNNSEAIEMDQF